MDMKWMISFFVAMAILLLGVLEACHLAKPSRRKSRIITAFNVMLCSVFVSAFAMFLPIYNEIFAGETFQLAKAVLLAVHNTIRLFIVDVEFGIITDHITREAGWVYTAYSCYAAILFVLAPLLTFGMVLSFFKNLSAWRRYLSGYFKEVYVFSEMNEKSLMLASSIRRENGRCMLVFTNAFENEEGSSFELLEQAKKMGAICFKKEMQAVKFWIHSKKKDLYFFVIGAKESENLSQSLKLIEQYREIPNTHLFVFSTHVEGELLLTSIEKGNMKVRRVNDVRSLINRILYEEGVKLFEDALPGEDGKKHISAVVVGLGKHGSSMVKALSWFCQMDGYNLTVDAFERDPLACDKFYAQCPELMSEKYNGVSVPGEAQYQVRIHEGVDADSRTFAEEIAKLNRTTYVLVALGSDEENVRVAAYLRMLFERNGAKPRIQAIVFNSEKGKALNKITNYRGQPYGIDFIGDLEASYSSAVILNSELENDALGRHLKWGSEEDFWKYEYNYSSSVASAIHMKAREALQIPGAGKREDEMTEEERSLIEQLEHRRWNAYMRSEGYIYSGSPESSSRNDLGKMHNDLVDFCFLPEEEKRKDSKVGSR